MGRILLARSATTDYDEQDRIVGRLDLPINVRGQAELLSIANDWRDARLATIYAAANESARMSATVVGKQLGVKCRVLPDLANLDFGLWQGLTVDDVRRKHPKLYKQWEECPLGICPPAGETVEQVFERLPQAARPLLKRRGGSAVAVFAPDPLRLILRAWLTGIDPARLWDQPADKAWESIEIVAEPGATSGTADRS